MNSSFFDQYQRPIIGAILLSLILVLIIAAGQGAMELDWRNLFQADSMEYYIVWNIRVPRILAALLVGGALALSGAIMQGLFRNPIC